VTGDIVAETAFLLGFIAWGLGFMVGYCVGVYRAVRGDFG
jgi:hypothetical protein